MRIAQNIFGGLWLLFVASWYFQYHVYYVATSIYTKELLWLLLGWAFLYGIIGFIQGIHKKKDLIITPIRVFFFGLIAVLLTGMIAFIVLNPAVFNEPYKLVLYEDNQFAVVPEGAELIEGLEPMFERGSIAINHSKGLNMFPREIQNMFTSVSLPVFMGNLFVKTVTTLGVWIVLIVLFYGLGARFIRPPSSKQLHFFSAVGTGMAITMLTLFLLGIFKILTPNVVGITMGVLLFRAIWESKPLFKAVWQYRTKVSYPSLLWFIPLLSVLGVTLSLNFIDVLRPIPIGHDALARYYNTPSLLTQYNELISGIPAYNFELIISLGQFVFNSTMIAVGISSLAGFLALALLYDTLKSVVKSQHALLLTTLFISLPMVSFLMHIDMKVDLSLLFISLLAVRSILEKRYALGGLFLGVAFGIKYTAAILIVTVFGFLGFSAWGAWGLAMVGLLGLSIFGVMGSIVPLKAYANEVKIIVELIGLVGAIAIGIGLFIKKKFSRKLLKPLLVTGLAMVLAFSPWLIKNGWDSKSITPQSLLFGESPRVVLDWEDQGIEQESCPVITEYDFDLGTYTNNKEGLSLLASTFWTSTVNPARANDRFTDISFIFLGFAVFVLLGYAKARKKNTKLDKIALFTLFYGLFWLLSANGVVWYGMMAFLGVLIIYSEVWKRERWPYVILGVWFLMSLILRFADTYVENTTLLYAGGLSDKDLYEQQRFENVIDMAEIINDEQSDRNIYITESFIQYFIEENNQRTYSDNTLRYFSCYFRSEDPAKTLARLREENFGYIVYSEKVLFAEPEGKGSLHEQYEWLRSFADQYLIKELESPNLGVTLYRVP